MLSSSPIAFLLSHACLVSYVGESPLWPIQSPNKEERKKKVKG